MRACCACVCTCSHCMESQNVWSLWACGLLVGHLQNFPWKVAVKHFEGKYICKCASKMFASYKVPSKHGHHNVCLNMQLIFV